MLGDRVIVPLCASTIRACASVWLHSRRASLRRLVVTKVSCPLRDSSFARFATYVGPTHITLSSDERRVETLVSG